MRNVSSTEVPSASSLHQELHDAYFHDCHKTEVASDRPSALDFYLNLASRTPAWVNWMMTTRNKIAGLFGLKNLGLIGAIDRDKPASDYRVGDRVGIFQVLSISAQEVILGDSDRHLDVKISIVKLRDDARPSIAISTVVHVHNALGRVYMFFVAPAHRMIAPAMLSRVNFTAKES